MLLLTTAQWISLLPLAAALLVLAGTVYAARKSVQAAREGQKHASQEAERNRLHDLLRPTMWIALGFSNEELNVLVDG